MSYVPRRGGRKGGLRSPLGGEAVPHSNVMSIGAADRAAMGIIRPGGAIAFPDGFPLSFYRIAATRLAGVVASAASRTTACRAAKRRR